MNTNRTPAELAALLGWDGELPPDPLAPTTKELDTAITSVTSKAKPKASSFLTKQFPLFSTPILTIYLQGVLPFSETWTLSDFLANSKARLINHPKLDQFRDQADDLILENFFLYSAAGKTAQLSFISALVAADLKVDPSRCLSKAWALSQVEAYKVALADYLIKEGFESPQEWLQSKKTTSAKLSLDDLNSLDLDF